jgi:hypothetical protein
MRNLYLVGTLISLIGFSSPWFKFKEGVQWWYGGWQLMQYEGLNWIFLIYLGYTILLIAGYFLNKDDDYLNRLLIILSLIIILSTFIPLSVSSADSIDKIRTLEKLVWNIGLPIMLIGHAMMLWSIFSANSYKMLKEFLEA